MMRLVTQACVLALSLVVATCACADAAVPSFRITQLFSNVDGSLQYVELTETAGQDGQSHFRGLELTSTRGGVVKRYVFPDDLPTDRTAHLSIVVTFSDFNTIPVRTGAGYYCCYHGNFELTEPHFLATDGGTVDFAGVDQVTYARLPISGITSIDRDGNLHAATVPGNACLPGVGCNVPRYAVAQTYTSAVEYYHATSGRHFWTVSEPDLDALDSGRLSGWQRTGQRILVSAVSGAYAGLTQPVCRFLDPSSLDHFYSASSAECAEVAARFPALQFETAAAFYVALPDADTGKCPPDDDINGLDFLLPLYRLWNPATSDHRYTTVLAEREQLIAQGYVAEGYGPAGVAMCVP